MGDFRETQGRWRLPGLDPASGSAGQLQMSHSAFLSLSCPICITVAMIFTLSPSLAVPMLRGDAGWERHSAGQGLELLVCEIQSFRSWHEGQECL